MAKHEIQIRNAVDRLVNNLTTQSCRYYRLVDLIDRQDERLDQLDSHIEASMARLDALRGRLK